MGDPPILTTATLTASGLSDNDIRRAARTGDLVRVGRGMYLHRLDVDALGEVGVHRVRARHFGRQLSAGTVLSHVSAAALHGLDLWTVPLEHVHVSRPPHRHGRMTSQIHVHPTELGDDVVLVDGLPVTSAARTVVDLARTLPRDQAVVVGDSALRLYPDVASDLPRVLADSGQRHGLAKARAVVPFLDGRSESVGESLSRIRIAEAGLPRPILQHEIVTADGRRYRVDFYWENGVVGEFDGRMKYTDSRALFDEKLRQDAIRDAGFEVVRWTWAELERFDVVAERLRKAARRAAAASLTR
ncbi:type IV toxin-antitoxin system AbiEi family antitoxin domain-containing protein [Rhodococcus sp. Z13]|uniref:Type IV toxin-antitoxin system AbiEi family antitoxin domain-containing protein n=1 Tax=Rhodococcus sacchari TaxID=2962047 RepID=A0ACD4DJE2_9NOCA|nr:type IV toxin-antitoxin system AbiEi family antitoxin domain-containing protein [Rhodococcus sp. Z13]UYP20162.1 type IV toxin-antitoxin system AbiEi family antitoxin domain-containing protein [Rhodococcus sp. Z13]